jgi:hypothetical protein
VTGEDPEEKVADLLAEQKELQVITGTDLEGTGIEGWSNWRADLGHWNNNDSDWRGAAIFEELFFTWRRAP